MKSEDDMLISKVNPSEQRKILTLLEYIAYEKELFTIIAIHVYSGSMR